MRISKTFKRILVLLGTIAFTFIGVYGLKFCLTSPSITELFNYHTNELLEDGENVEMVFVGASRIYHGFDPKVFEEELGYENVLNDATPAQRTVLSYYMLKDMIEKFDPKCVVFGTTYNGLMFEQGLKNFTYAMDRLSLGNRVACATDIFGTIDGLMILTGKSEYLKEENFEKMASYASRRFKRMRGINDTDAPKYYENGYMASFISKPQGSIDYGYGEDRSFNEKDIDPKALEYLEKSIQLCLDHDIEMILVSGMCTTARMYSVENYQGVTDYFTELAEKYGIRYINMNYLRNREELFPDTVFIDDQHLNDDGGQIQSVIFAQILKDEFAGKDTSHYFYSNLEELTKDIHRVPGCTAAASLKDNTISVDCECVHNSDIVPMYRVSAVNEETGDKTIMTDWTVKSRFEYSNNIVNQYDYILIETKSGEPGETYAYHEIDLHELT